MGTDKKNNLNVILENCSVKIILASDEPFHWSPELHFSFNDVFKNKITNFLFCLKHFQKETKIKIPKFVLFEIIKKTL